MWSLQGAKATVAYYNFNVGRGASLLDLTTNNYMGTLTNMSSSSDWVSGFELGVTISGNSGFRMMSSPVAGQIYSDLLAELWIQGMTGGDITGGTANVWTLSGQSWSALSNLSTASLTAGQGFLVYVYADTDADGDDDLPVTLSVSGTENSSSATVPSSGSIADGDFALAGNPYASTIDFDNITLNNIAVTTSVWDDANTDWKTWNKTSQGGDLSGGLIAPYQGFWITGDGGSGTITIETADKSGTAGTFYRITDDDEWGNVVFEAVSGDWFSESFISFYTGGTPELDEGDSELLLPLQASPKIVIMSIVDEQALKITSFPYEDESSLTLPLDIMVLNVDGTSFITEAGEVTLFWDLSQLPDHVNLVLTDEVTNMEINLSLQDEYIFTTEPKGSFSAVPNGAIGSHPVVGEPRFTLQITYSALGSNSHTTIPSEFALHPVYPNPFNPSTVISFAIPKSVNKKTSLHIYDLKGRLVETLINQLMKPGKYKIRWDPINLSSGVYLVKLKAGNKSFTQKITYIK